jgi:hypothetical protein
MTICSRKRCGSVRPLLLLILPLATGCGGQATGTVSGTVTYQGKPLSSGFVTFVMEKGSPPLSSEIQSDGSYRMVNVPVGPVKIGVRPKIQPETALESSSMPRNPQDMNKFREAMIPRETPIPPKYHDPLKSGLTYTVTEGSQQHNIVLP